MRAVRSAHLVLSLVTLAFGVIACGSSSSNNGPPSDAGTDIGADVVSMPEAGADVIVDPMNCVPFGTAGNDQGIGGYCSPSGGQCNVVGPGGSARICTADVPGTPPHAWFCTYPCMHTTECGAGAACVTTSMGSSCVPTACDLADGGMPDAAPETGDDSSMPDGAGDSGDGSPDGSTDGSNDSPADGGSG
jgi:hypothetical protein